MSLIQGGIITILKQPGRPIEIVRTNRDMLTYDLHNKSLITLYVLKGWKRGFKKSMKSWHIREPVPLTNISVYPGDVSTLVKSPDSIRFLCTLKGHCLQEMHERQKTMERENLDEYKTQCRKITGLEAEIKEKNEELGRMRVDYQKATLKLEEVRRSGQWEMSKYEKTEPEKG